VPSPFQNNVPSSTLVDSEKPAYLITSLLASSLKASIGFVRSILHQQ